MFWYFCETADFMKEMSFATPRTILLHKNLQNWLRNGFCVSQKEGRVFTSVLETVKVLK
jgi:hypothetical protein